MTGARIAMNVIAFQAAWLGGVAGGVAELLWLGPAALAAAAAHLALAAAPARELGAVAFAGSATALALQGAGWAVLLPLASAIATRLDGTVAASAEPARV